VYENRVLRKVHGPKREEVILTQYRPSDQIKNKEVDGACGT
jgi:hypothetical protein